MGALTLKELIQFPTERARGPRRNALIRARRAEPPDVHRPLPRRSSRKWAKRIRRILGYHPNEKRLYMDTSRNENKKYGGGEWLLANCSRAKYQLMKGRTA